MDGVKIDCQRIRVEFSNNFLRKNKLDRQISFPEFCFVCKRRGHWADECRQAEKNERKYLSSFKQDSHYRNSPKRFQSYNKDNIYNYNSNYQSSYYSRYNYKKDLKNPVKKFNSYKRIKDDQRKSRFGESSEKPEKEKTKDCLENKSEDNENKTEKNSKNTRENKRDVKEKSVKKKSSSFKKKNKRRRKNSTSSSRRSSSSSSNSSSSRSSSRSSNSSSRFFNKV
jgi:hypothetical protein